MPQKEKTAMRREEIINACRSLYETMYFKDVSIREIAAKTSFSRPSIYNYFLTKEEIFLALLTEEYHEWNRGLARLGFSADTRKEDFARETAALLSRRKCLLRLLSTDLSEMEQNCRMECLTAFKTEYGRTLQELNACLLRCRPQMKEEQLHAFLYAYLPMIQGIYPYAEVSDKQREAMRLAGVPYVPQSLEDLLYNGTLTLLNGIVF